MRNGVPTVWGYFQNEYKTARKGRLTSPASVSDYETQIGHFGCWWLGHLSAEGESYRPALITDLTRENVLAALAWQDGRGRGGNTVNKLRAVLLALANQAAEVYPMAALGRIPKWRVPRRSPSSWSVDQIGALIGVAGKLTGSCGAVSRADLFQGLLWLQYNSGSRISALMAARWPWFDFSAGDLTIPAEATKDREDSRVTLFSETVSALLKLRVGSVAGPFDHWPYDRSARPWPALLAVWRRIVYCAFVEPGADPNAVTKRQAKAAVDRRSLTHKVRRSFATEVASREGIDAACALLGHSSRQVTECYVDTSKLAGRSQAAVLPVPVPHVPEPAPVKTQLRLFG